VLRPDQLTVQAHLDGWDLHVAHDGRLTRWAPGQLYKAKRPGAPDEHDAGVAIPRLSGSERAWLTAAIAKDTPDHHWLPLLADTDRA
jgi:hypothetical protein